MIEVHLCPDGKLCKVEDEDPLHCRHGVINKKLISDSLGGYYEFVCPLELQKEHEKKQWAEFMRNFKPQFSFSRWIRNHGKK